MTKNAFAQPYKPLPALIKLSMILREKKQNIAVFLKKKDVNLLS
uniref:Uncharacterized protein n=1 Tax=Candidozyma auris TaxID=498019 RepID=A0A0L0NT27_CANAR